MKATWNNEVIAESDKTVIVEGNHYFPAKSVKMELLKKNGEQYTCPWKGVCDYYDIEAGGEINSGAAFIYADPSELAREIKGHVSFWKGVEVTD